MVADKMVRTKYYR